MEKAQAFMAESVEHYRELARLTKDTYEFANSMQTRQRRIPVPGGTEKENAPANYHWTQLVGLYESELVDFESRVASLKSGSGATEAVKSQPLQKAPITILTKGIETYDVEVGAKVFRDQPYTIAAVAPQLRGLSGIRISHENAKNGKYEPIEFQCDQPVQVLIGYFQSPDKAWLQPPQLETDALAGERGGAEVAIANAVTIDSLPPVNVRIMRFEAGRHKLDVRGNGSFVILGFVSQKAGVR
jgi:hypothetical protein